MSSKRAGSPEEAAGFLSRITFSWLNPLLALGHTRPLTEEDLPDLSRQDTAEVVSRRFQEAWDSQLRSVGKAASGLSFGRALLAADHGRWVSAAPLKFMHDCLHLVGPVAMGGILRGLEIEDVYHSRRTCVTFVALLACSMLTQSLVLQNYFMMTMRSAAQARSATISAVFRKSLRLSKAASSDYTTGEMVNLMSVDAQNVGPNLIPYLHLLWSGPFQIALALIMLHHTIGVAAFAGFGVMLLLLPLNIALTRREVAATEVLMKKKDARVRLLNELISGVRQIKLFAWERRFLRRVLDARDDELLWLKKQRTLSAVCGFVWVSTPVLVAATSFTVLALVRGPSALTPEEAFPALALFNVVRFPLTVLPEVISAAVDANVSANRIAKFLSSGEVEGRVHIEDGENAKIRGGEYNWNGHGSSSDEGNDGQSADSAPLLDAKDLRPVLSGIHLEFPSGSLTAIVGPVGSGKSSLLSALLGEMSFSTSDDNTVRATMPRTISYAPQIPWILNSTIRENILFGEPMDERRYKRTVDACALALDLQHLAGGDQTEIGEKGVNLSGGQKARVCLARALYRRADVYLFDDPLSALDSHVGRHVFEAGIKDMLRGETRILVTHQLSVLSDVDYVVSLSTSGQVHEVVEVSKTRSTSLSTESQTVQADLPSNDDQAKSRIVDDEERLYGGVERRVYAVYLLSIGVLMVILCLIFLFLMQTFLVSFDGWLAKWSTDAASYSEHNVDMDPKFYLTVYLSLGLLGAFFSFCWYLSTAFAGIRGARVLHENMLRRVVRAPMSFFDTTPVGRILNRFSRDIDAVDRELPGAMRSYIGSLVAVCLAVCVVAVATPLGLLAIIPLTLMYHRLGNIYLTSSRELKRLESISKSPLLSHFGETVQGAGVIRAFDAEDMFRKENEARLDGNVKKVMQIVTANRWLSLRVELVGNLLVSTAALAATFGRGSISAGAAGLSISYALKITGTLGWMVRGSTNVETQMNSVERIRHYSMVDSEAAETQPGVDENLTEWPSRGEVVFENVAMRYRPGLPLVLNDVNIRVEGGTKCGIVGRTGSGKSSLTMSLFRMVELAQGRILVDSVDLASIGLDALRSRIAIISQDPQLFTGTVRGNLDPFEEYSESEVWSILERVSMKEYISSLPLGLDTIVSEGGDNFSAGQKQLLCLARALLRNAKVVVLDEATASCDFRTDEIIQSTLRRGLKNTTLVVIAHRLDTVMDADQIVVLDQGKVAESGTPHELLLGRGILSGMVDRLGINDASRLRCIAEDHSRAMGIGDV